MERERKSGIFYHMTNVKQETESRMLKGEKMGRREGERKEVRTKNGEGKWGGGGRKSGIFYHMTNVKQETESRMLKGEKMGRREGERKEVRTKNGEGKWGGGGGGNQGYFIT